MTIKTNIIDVFEIALCFVRKAWRPVTCIGISGGSLVNLVIIPLWTMTVPDLTAAAAYVAAASAAFGIRAFEKWKGVE